MDQGCSRFVDMTSVRFANTCWGQQRLPITMSYSVPRAQLVPLPQTGGVLKYPLPAPSPLTCSGPPSTLVSLATLSPPQILCTRTGPVPLDGYPFISCVGC